jgi:hypothetical protein
MRASKSLIVVFVVLAIAIAVAGWSALRQQETLSEVVATPHTTVAESEPSRSGTLGSPADAPSDTETGLPAASGAGTPRAAVVDPTRRPEADLLWLEGSVQFPEGTPLDEVVEIVALGRDSGDPASRRGRVGAQGSFRLACDRDARTVRLTLEARHLYLETPALVRMKDGAPASPVRLEPKLGACVIGQVRAPAGLEATAAAGLVGAAVSAWGWFRDPAHGREGVNRHGALDAELRYEIRGLDPRCEYRLGVETRDYLSPPVEQVRFAAGETRILDLDLRRGVRLSGRVIDPDGGPPRELSVIAETLPPGGAPGDGSSFGYATIAEDGSFEVGAVAPGEITLLAGALQRPEAELRLGRLQDGEARQGLEIRMERGGRIEGRVTMPDGTAAKGARITLLDLSDEGDSAANLRFLGRRNSEFGAVTTSDDGRFAVEGLGAGPYRVAATLGTVANAGAASAKQSSPAPFASASLDGVRPGGGEILLVLTAGHTLTGRLVDDLGEPLLRFQVTATPRDNGVLDEERAISKAIRSKDGSFELTGVPPGEHRLEVRAMNREAPDPVDIVVPRELGPFTFVATRRGSIAGVVRLPNGAPAPRATLHVYMSSRHGPDRPRGRTDADGTFKVSNVAPGMAHIQARLEGYAASEALAVQCVPGDELQDVTLYLRLGGRITGLAHPAAADDALQGREVHAILNGGFVSQSTSTDAQGEFVLEELPPGQYTLWLMPSPAELERNRAAWETESGTPRLEPGPTRQAIVSLAEGGEAHVVFGVPPGAAVPLAGSVRRAGKPLGGMSVCAFPSGAPDEREAVYGTTDGSGRFGLSLPRAGSYRVVAGALLGRNLPEGRTFEVPEAGLRNADLDLSTSRVRVHVTATGRALTGFVQVRLQRNEREQAHAANEVLGRRETEFEFENVGPGTYKVLAGYWIPGTADNSQFVEAPAITVDLAPGQEQAEVRVTLGNE